MAHNEMVCGPSSLVPRGIAVLAVLLTGAACGDDSPENPTPTEVDPIRAARLTGVPLAPSRQQTLEGPASALGVNDQGQPILGANEVIAALGENGLELRRLFAGPGDPLFLGGASAILPRTDGGAWLGAETGLFQVDTLYVLPVSSEVAPIRGLAEATDGPLAGMWLMTPEALFLSLPEELARFEIPDRFGDHTGFAVDPKGRRAITIVGPEVLVLVPNQLDLDLFSLPLTVEAPLAVAATEEALWLAGDGALFGLPHASPTDQWIEVRIDETAVHAVALAADPTELFVLDETGRLFDLKYPNGFEAGAAEGFATLIAEDIDASDAPQLAADGRGGVWLGQTNALEGFRLDVPSFEDDVRPFIEAECVQCHAVPGADFRELEWFEPRAEDALDRIRSGDMPRCENNQRCPDDRALSPADYSVLERWILGGKLP